MTNNTTATIDTNAHEAAQERRVRINLQLSQGTHQRIKVYCVQRRTTMQAALEAMLDKAFSGVRLE